MVFEVTQEIAGKIMLAGNHVSRFCRQDLKESRVTFAHDPDADIDCEAGFLFKVAINSVVTMSLHECFFKATLRPEPAPTIKRNVAVSIYKVTMPCLPL